MRKFWRWKRPSDPVPPSRKARWGRRVLWSALAIVFVGVPVALWFLPSIGLRYVLQQQLRNAGMDTVEIAEVNLSLLNGQFGVRRASANAPQGPETRLDDLAILFEWRPLFSRRVSLGTVSLQGLRLDVAHDATGRLVVSGLPLPNAAPSPDAPGGSQWLLGIDRLQIKDSTLVYTRNSQRITLAVDLLVVENLRGWEPEAAGRLDFVGSFNGAPVAVSGEFAPFATRQHANLRLSAERIDIARISPIFADPELTELRGELDFNLASSATVTPGASVEAEFEGGAELRDAVMRLGDVSVSGSRFNWSGIIRSTPVDATVTGTLAVNEVAIESPDVTLAIGYTETTVDPFSVRFANLAALSFDWRAKLDADTLRATAGDAEITQGSLSLALVGSAEGSHLALTAGAIEGADIAIEAGKNRLTIGEASLATQRLAAVVADGPQVDWDGHVDIGNIKLASGAANLSQGRVNWDGKIKLEADGDVTATGTLTSADLSLADAATKIAVGAAKVALAPLQLAGHDDPKLRWKGRVELGTTSVNVPGFSGEPGTLVFDGKAEFDADAPAPRGSIEGKLTAGRTRIQLPDLAAWIEQQSATANATVLINGKAAIPVAMRATIAVTGLTAGSTRTPHDYVSLGRLDIEDARMSSDGAAAIAAVRMSKLQSIQRRGQGKDTGYPWRAEFGRATLSKLARTASGDMSAAGLDIESLLLRVTNTATGLHGSDALPQSSMAKPAPPAPPRAPAPGRAPPSGPGIALGYVEVKGDSRIVFEDRVPTKGVRMTVAAIGMRLDKLDSTRPAQPSPIRLSAKLGDFSALKLSGTVRPFAAKLNLDIQARLTGFSLPTVSPYAADLLGVNLQTGRFDGDIAIKVIDEKLDGTTTLKVSNLDLAEVAKGEGKLAAGAGMPIETVVGLLQDGDGVITLHIPIAGELSDPKFDLSEAIGQAVAGAVRDTASTLLSVVFPVVPLLEAAEAADTRRGLDLRPIDYAAGSAELTDAHRRYLGDLAKLLAGRPGLHLNVCGYAGPRDWPPIFAARLAAAEAAAAPKTSVGIVARQAGDLLRNAVGATPRQPPPTPPADPEALSDLASERGRAVKSYLANAGGVSDERLFECRPEVESDESAKPRVELRF